MEVKSVYMDLVEGKQTSKGTWKLESEAFKKPIELKIGYDNHELKEFYGEIAEIKHQQELQEKKITRLDGDNVNHNLFREEFQNKVNNKQQQIDELRETIKKQNGEISQLYKVIADAKTTIETQSGTILKLQDKVKELEKKASKQPMVYSDKTFISGHESCGLSMIEIPSGEYLVISKYVIGQHNEYVLNENDIAMEKITVNDNCYIPMYQLVGGTDLDTPTADVYRTLTFIPC